jgi:ATP phosphoribosyltransferase regulatory subunit
MRGFKYYSGMGFTLFSKNIAGALGRGGHYDVHFGGRKHTESASGFTLYMDTVRKAMPAAKKTQTAKAGYGDHWNEIREQQRKGAIVIRGKGKK